MKLGMFWCLVISVSLSCIGLTQANSDSDSVQLQQLLQQLVHEERASSKLVGLGAIVVRGGQVSAPVVSGERKVRSQVLLAAQDKWHIGSITKSFTATMIARLVESGQLSWQTTLVDVFPEVENIHPQWLAVTVEQLLTHTSGAPPNFSAAVSRKNPAEGAERTQAREAAVLDVLKNQPATAPGKSFVYSNVGYTIAGVIAEKQSGLTWESLIRQEILEPLQLTSAGFGAPQDKNDPLGQPRGHRKLLGFKMAAGAQADNTPIVGPAGTLHLSLPDLARYGQTHLEGEQGRSSLLSADSFQHLHRASLDDYAYGWVVKATKELNAGPVLWHNGSNTMWYAMLAIIPKFDLVIAVTSNDGNIAAAEGSAWSIIEKILDAVKSSD